MSIEAVMSRVSQLQSMLAAGTTTPAPDTSKSFSTALANATGSTPSTFASLASPLGTQAATAVSPTQHEHEPPGRHALRG